MANPPESRASNRPLIFTAVGVVLLAAAGTLTFCDELGLSGRTPAPGPTASVPVPPAVQPAPVAQQPMQTPPPPQVQPAQPPSAQAAAQAEAAAREAAAREAAAREAAAREAAAQAAARDAIEAARRVAAQAATQAEAAAREAAAREAAAREAAARETAARETAAREAAAREAAAREAQARAAADAAQRAATPSAGPVAQAIAPAPAPAQPPASAPASAPSAPATSAPMPSAPAPAQPPASAPASAPSAPAPQATAPSVAAVVPSFDIVRVNPAGSAVIAGRAAPGTDVAIRDGGREIGRVRADERGEWVFTPDQPLAPGARELTLATPGADGRMADAPGTVVLVVPEPGRDIAGRPAATPRDAQALALLVPGQPGAAPQVLQVPPAPAPAPAPAAPNGATAAMPAPTAAAPHPLALGVVEYGADGAALLGGRAQAGSLVRVYLGNRHIGDARADALGRWSLSPREAIPPGEHTLRLDQIAANGSVAHRVELPLSRAEAAQAPAQAGAITVRPGQSLWRIARQIYGRGPRFIEIYQANRAQIRNPNLIYPGQVLAVPGPG